MRRLFPVIGIFLIIIIYCVAPAHAIDASQSDGPFGLRWAMSKEDIETMQIRLCCRQVGQWGERYEVHPRDFKRLPKSLGDEEKLYLYFGNINKLPRLYVSIRKVDARNRFNQLNVLIGKRYDSVHACTQENDNDCNGYKAYNTYQKGDIEVEVALEENLTSRDKIFITLINKTLHKIDQDEENPF